HLLARQLVGAGHEDDAGVARLSKTDGVTRLQFAFGDPLTVDVRPELRLAVAQQDASVLHQKFCVLPRDVGACQPDVTFAAAPESRDGTFNGNGAAAKGIGDDQPRRYVGSHGMAELYNRHHEIPSIGRYGRVRLGTLSWGDDVWRPRA